ncbi:MAG: glycoside hydrolase family 5 protein [Candidatus Goldbacteria bacterium]|nr:glycoside hydrolase family 5 protein [Candidatus Goldiibacteriota bacterium]
MKLTGMNLGGFFSQVKNDIFTDSHIDSFITEKDLKTIRDWGFNCVRLPVDNFFFEIKPYQYDEKRLKKIDEIINISKKYGLQVILDLHKTAGHSFALKERDKNDIWDKNSDNRKRFLSIWNMFSDRYKDYENIIYEILNEPIAPDYKTWNELCDETIDVIRKNDRNHYIVIESNMWGRPVCFEGLKKFSDDKIIYSFHFYEPIVVTHQMAYWVPFVIYNIYKKYVKYPGRPQDIADAKEKLQKKDEKFATFLDGQDKNWNIKELEELLKPVLDFRNRYNVPIFCGEFGCIVVADPQTRKNWTSDIITIFKKQSISWTYWSYKNMDFGVIDYTETYKDNPNYSKDRIDHNILEVLKNGIF